MPLNIVGNNPDPSIITGVAATGNAQSNAFQLVHNAWYRFDTAASGTGVILPIPQFPDEVTLFNHGANALLVYPPVGGAINGGTINAPVSLAAGSAITYWGTEGLGWWTQTTGGGGGGSGTVSSGTSGQLAGYAATGATVSGVALGTYLALVPGSPPTLNASGPGTGNPVPFRWSFGVGSPIAVATGPLGVYMITQWAGTWTRWDVSVGLLPGGGSGMPTGANAILDIFTSVDHGVTWVSLWPTTPANRPTITAGGSIQASGTAFDNAAYVAGTLIRPDVAQVGSIYPGAQVVLEVC